MHSIAWRNACQLRNQLSFSAQFHSTQVSFAKWKNKWDCKHEKKDKKPSKNYVRYVVRQKRAEEKKALKNYLLYGKPSQMIFKDEEANSFSNSCEIPRFKSFGKSKTQNSSQSKKGQYSARKSRGYKQQFYDFYEEEKFINHEKIFETIFGQNRGFTWSYIPWENFHNFQYRMKNPKAKTYYNESGTDEESDNYNKNCNFNSFVGSSANRAALGLPSSGPLQIEDVKLAFRASALKWHPDKHQGPSQEIAAEKFKLCVNAYHTLCSDLQAN
ncbi:hypothetical protein LUZ60_015988 [Juncus effusus]|nr:hypothetical protein LUZ60_015988 [Juncus effusus]